MKNVLQLLTLLIFASVNAQKTTWKIDPAHSDVAFEISYFKVGEIKGNFNVFQGDFTLENDDVSTAKINISIDATSINTNQVKRDAHLQKDEFFNTEKYPTITFKSTSIKKISDDNYQIKGDFTMRGITKSITLQLEYKGSFMHPRFKNKRKFFNVTGVIQREDFEVATNYPPAEFALGKGVKLNAVLQVILQ